MNDEKLFKVLLIGDSGVGKSCLLLRWADDLYTDTYINTIGVDFKMKKININGNYHKVQVWDTAGQERFQTITSSYYRGANAIMMVYDITQSNSKMRLMHWHSEINKYATKNVPIIIIGTKKDLESERKVEFSIMEKYAQSVGAKIIETSAKSNINVEEAFELASKAILTGNDDTLETNETVDLNKDSEKKKKCCK
eukprot:TRINITY_DN1128_c2_g1_i1.p1 TRINITY_DN1128_c2_g1~~TRINITY_DN1128_c2_g1_i1.p1  ORF type:complete len:196 (-),score=40.45 TRINITY_DN1128_c2_g1_i1:63-650(-)